MGAHNTLTIEGLTELRAALRRLPEALATEANVIVWAQAQEAYRRMDAEYAKHDVSGTLRDRLTVSRDEAYMRFGARAVVTNTAPHAWWAENGTELRRTTGAKSVKAGVSRGAMRPLHIFVPIAQRVRRMLEAALEALVRRAGLTVSNTDRLAA